MNSKDKKSWVKAVDEEHSHMEKYKVFKAVKKNSLPKKAKVLSSTWAMKKKANGAFHARVPARGFEQVNGIRYDEDTKASPVMNEATILITFVLMLLAGWVGYIVDVNGVFLHSHFEEKHEMYLSIPKGFEKYYGSDVVLLLQQTLYGTKQVVLQFWRELLKSMVKMFYKRSKADPCLFFKRNQDKELSIWILWVDDLLTIGKPSVITMAKHDMMCQFECDNVGKIEFLGNKIEIDHFSKTAKFTQPVLLQGLKDEFVLKKGKVKLPATAGSILSYKGEGVKHLSPEKQRDFQSGMGKLLHLSKWSRPDIKNSVQELSHGMTQATEEVYEAMQQVMAYCVATPSRGLVLAPEGQWSGRKDEELIIMGMSDTTYASDYDTRRSVMGRVTFLNSAPIIVCSKMCQYVDLSVTESELGGATETAQDMLSAMCIIESMGLTVKKPMILYVDNKGVKDLVNN
jgi:Reverse transcriptase (RNA-dependent DNA polymerase)